jgi:DNA damage-inducible protein 1
VSQDLISVHTSPGITVKDLKVLVEADTGFPAAAQQFYLNGRALSNEVQTLDDAGIKDGEMLMLLVRRRGNPPQGTAPQTTARGNPDPEDVRQQLLNNPAARANLSQNAPDLFATLNDPGRWREEYNNMVRRQQDAERERQEQIEVLNNDPFNVDAQRKIEDIIRQDRVIENLQHAYEHNPEG